MSHLRRGIEIAFEENRTSSGFPAPPAEPRGRGNLEVCLDRIAQERRATRRYELHLPLHFRVSQKGAVARWGTGVTREMSTTGLSFRARKPLPIGAHVELIVDWPAKYANDQPIDLQLTGFVVRSDNHRTAVRVTSRRFRINSHFEPYRATA
jgi:hypothetical protein